MDSKTAKAPTIAVRLRNFVLTILMMSFPLGIFLLPLWLRTRSYPRIVVSLTTIPERLPHIRPTLESLLYDQTVAPTVVYLILPQQDYYGTSQTPKDFHFGDPSSWPDFLTHMLETTQLEILQPTSDYGPITKVLHALEKEKQWSDEQEMIHQQPKSTVVSNENTRIIYLDDDVQYHRKLIQLLVDASLEYEYDGDASAVVALSGGRLRNNFRQIKHSNRNYDKAPNLYMEVSWDLAAPQQVDIVQGFTGVCLHAKDGWKWLPSIYSVLQDSEHDTGVPKAVLQSDDVLLSAIMEEYNETRWVVPGMAHIVKATNSSKVAPLSSKGMHSNLIEATYYLQQQLGIWNNYELLDWSTLTLEQRHAIDCEAKHAQDCSTSVCVPNPKHCPDAQAVLQDLMSP
jgi:hypothetical protein